MKPNKLSRDPQFDIVNLILEDHKPIKDLVRVMKNSDLSLPQLREALEKFTPLLQKHAEAEQEVLYVYMKHNKGLRKDGFAGDVEHAIAEQILEEVKTTKDEDLWCARVKVLAQLVERHLQEEENILLPEVRQNASERTRTELGHKYIERKSVVLPSIMTGPRDWSEFAIQH